MESDDGNTTSLSAKMNLPSSQKDSARSEWYNLHFPVPGFPILAPGMAL